MDVPGAKTLLNKINTNLSEKNGVEPLTNFYKTYIQKMLPHIFIQWNNQIEGDHFNYEKRDHADY